MNHSRRALLAACLDSLLAQQDVAFEVILVDNASTDDSVQMARARFENNSRFRLQILELDENIGFCAGNNRGIAIASGRYIALLNNDAEAHPRWLAELLAALDARPDFGMAASKILVYEDPSRIDKAGHLIYLDGQNRGRGSGEVDLGQYDQVEEVLWPDGCAALYRKVMLEEIGVFDEDLFAYGDDAELGLRARIAGWRCIYVPTAVVRHHRGATLGLRSRRRLELIERNRILLAFRHFPASLLWANGLFFLMRLGAGLLAAVRGRGEVSRFPGISGKMLVAAALVRAQIEALGMLPQTIRKRNAMKHLRRLSASDTRRLLLAHRIPLRTLMEQAI